MPPYTKLWKLFIVILILARVLIHQQYSYLCTYISKLTDAIVVSRTVAYLPNFMSLQSDFEVGDSNPSGYRVWTVSTVYETRLICV